MPKKLKPLYDHGCEECEFLGSLWDMDMYRCPSPEGYTYILRNSEDGQDYASSLDFDNRDYEEVKRSVFKFEDHKKRNDIFVSRLVCIKLLATNICNRMTLWEED